MAGTREPDARTHCGTSDVRPEVCCPCSGTDIEPLSPQCTGGMLHNRFILWWQSGADLGKLHREMSAVVVSRRLARGVSGSQSAGEESTKTEHAIQFIPLSTPVRRSHLNRKAAARYVWILPCLLIGLMAGCNRGQYITPKVFGLKSFSSGYREKNAVTYAPD